MIEAKNTNKNTTILSSQPEPKLHNNNNNFSIYISHSNHSLGLENLRSTSYMNSVLQCLCNISYFKDYFQKRELLVKDINNKNAPLSKALYGLINKLWNKSNEQYYSPYDFKILIGQLNPLFKENKPNDSKELLLFFYETLHEELNSPNSYNQILYVQNIPNELKLFRKFYYSKNNSFISRLFYFEQRSNIVCLKCNTNIICFNVDDYLIFPLEEVRLYLIKKNPKSFSNITLYDCFELYEEKQLLNGDNKYIAKIVKYYTMLNHLLNYIMSQKY